MKRITTILIYVFLAATFTGFSQDDSYIFKNITASNGLSQHDVNCITQDKDGFLWFGTNDGLNKYDGYNFTVFKPIKDNDSSIKGRIIQDVETDSYGNLWIVTLDGGLNYFNSKKELFKNFNTKLADFGSYANKITISPDGILWVQFKSKLCYAILKENVDDMEFFPLIEESNTIREENTKRIYIKNKTVYYETNASSYSLDYIKSNTALKNISLKAEQTNNFISQLDDKGDAVWELRKEGVYHKNKASTAYLECAVTSESAVIDKKGALWCVIEDKLSVVNKDNGVLKYTSIDFETFDYLQLKNNSVKSIYLDNTGSLWVGTNGGGIYKKTTNALRFKHYNKSSKENSLSGNKIRSLHEDQFENLWIGTEGGGLSFLSKSNNSYSYFSAFEASKSKRGISSNNVFSIAENIIDANTSILWFSTENGGLNKLVLSGGTPPNLFNFKKYNNPTEDGSNINYRAIHSVLGEGSKQLWIGYYGSGLGLAKWSTNKAEPSFMLINSPNKKTQLSGKVIRDIFRDSYGILWLSTNNGLNKLNENSTDISKSTFASYKYDPKNKATIGSNYTLQIFESSNNTLWIGTIGGGLNKMLREEDGTVIGFKRYNKQNDLFPDDVINSIIEDDRGILWVGTNNGLIEFDPVTESFKTHAVNELRNPEISEISALKRRNGDLIFGGINGINVFVPGATSNENILPKTVITDLNIMYEPVKPFEEINGSIILENSITHTERLYLDSNINNFSFSFSSIHFNDPLLNKYTYMLEGFDKNWIETTADLRIANYTNIPTGDYVFKVYGSNNNGTWSAEPATIKITIFPPWYWTTLAKILYTFLVFFILLLSGKYTLINIKRKRNLEYERLEKEKEKELNLVKLEFFTNISHELRSPLTLILGPIEKLINKIDSIKKEDRLKSYTTIQRNADYLLKLTKQLLDFRKLEQGKLKLECAHVNLIHGLEKIIEHFYPLADKKNITLNYNFPKDKVFAWIDINKLEKITHNLLSNAVKFTQEKGEVSIKVRTQAPTEIYPEGFVEFSVKDNGKGIKQKELKNIFTRFYQAENQSKENDGVGIGLSFSQSLAKLHGGEIKVKSELQKGSCFTLELPLGAAHLNSDQMVEDKELILSGVDIPVLNNNNTTDEVVAFENGDKPILLIIEDNLDINHYIASEFSDNYTIISCMNGTKGMEVAFEKSPNIIISDIMMPGVDGIEVCDTLKSDIRTSHIPFILLSAKTTNESKVAGLQAGADVYLVKPFNMDVLKMQVSSLLENRGKIHAEFKKSPFEPSKIDVSSVDEQFIHNVVEIIEANLDNSLFSIKELSAKIGMSRTNFYNKMKAITGLKPTEFVRNYRLSIAAQYLEKGFSVKESMYKTGFNTAGYFTQSFKTLYKLTPSEYTNSLKEK